MIVLVYDNVRVAGDVAYERGSMVATGQDIETAIFLSLFLDAPALPTDVLPPGTPHRGFWADAYDLGGIRIGSRLWLLEQAEATLANADRSKTYAAEALRWLIDDGHILGLDITPELEGDAIYLGVTVLLRNGERSLGPFRVN